MIEYFYWTACETLLYHNISGHQHFTEPSLYTISSMNHYCLFLIHHFYDYLSLECIPLNLMRIFDSHAFLQYFCNLFLGVLFPRFCYCLHFLWAAYYYSILDDLLHFVLFSILYFFMFLLRKKCFLDTLYWSFGLFQRWDYIKGPERVFYYKFILTSTLD